MNVRPGPAIIRKSGWTPPGRMLRPKTEGHCKTVSEPHKNIYHLVENKGMMYNYSDGMIRSVNGFFQREKSAVPVGSDASNAVSGCTGKQGIDKKP
ncbi:MAG: hypothetical protein K5919_04125 [Clostridiales bacterium]|nr:hypothetical protein [Clostridiales bacterium]